jgi:hypothetical protein
MGFRDSDDSQKACNAGSKNTSIDDQNQNPRGKEEEWTFEELVWRLYFKLKQRNRPRGLSS